MKTGTTTLQVQGINHPEAMRILLSYVYSMGTGASTWTYEPTSAEVNLRNCVAVGSERAVQTGMGTMRA